MRYFERIDALGGMVAAIEQGFPQREIAESAYRFQQAVERGEQVIVGVNDYVATDEPPVEILYIDEAAGDAQTARLKHVRTTRDEAAVSAALRSDSVGRCGPGQSHAPDPRCRARLRHAR